MEKFIAKLLAAAGMLCGSVAAHEESFWPTFYELTSRNFGMLYKTGTWDEKQVSAQDWTDHSSRRTDVWGIEYNGTQFGLVGSIGDDKGVVDVIDVSDPKDPVRIGTWDSGYDIPIVDVKASGTVGFFASDKETASNLGRGLFIVSGLPYNPVTVAQIYPGNSLCPDATDGNQCSKGVHNISVKGDYIYFVDQKNTKLHVYRWRVNGSISVSHVLTGDFFDPEWADNQNHPDWQFGLDDCIAGCGTTFSHPERKIHDITVGGDFLYLARRRSCFVVAVVNGENVSACDGGITQILDISNPASPQYSGNYYIPSRWNTQNLVTIGGDLVYEEITKNSPNHSGWPSDDGNVLYMSGEAKGSPLQVVDISDPSDCELIKNIYPSDINLDPNAMIHNQVVHGDYLYVSWYTEGLTLFNIKDPQNPILIGRWDGHPGILDEDENGYGSIWGVFPFFGPSNILISDTEYGLHSLRVTSPIVPTILSPLLF